jgi:glycosyltransferase involved in cell wall biosynthesis
LDNSEIAIVIPAWNEAATIKPVVESVQPFGTVVVVNDASSDDTPKLAEQAGAVVVSHSQNRGYDGALNTGFAKADELGVRYIITYDADGQHDPENLPKIIEYLTQGAHLVVGRRPERARIAEKLFAFITWTAYGVRDPLCGLKGYDIKLYHDAGFFDNCNSIGTQLTIHACRNSKKYTIKQLPIIIHSRIDQPRFGWGIKPNLRILKAMIRVYK